MSSGPTTDTDGAERLFVYGTLRRAAGDVVHPLLAGHTTSVGDGSVGARLFDLGAYPGAVEASDSSTVRGELYALHRPEECLDALDRHEGCGPDDEPPYEFERGRVDVRLDSGEVSLAWIYWYAGRTDGRPRIRSGDYLMR